MPAKYTAEQTVSAFWSRVDKRGPDECWEWLGSRKSNGYGTFKLFRITNHAHRAAYELSIGPIPVGMNVCHSCDNPPCCNPAHLWLGTQADNIKDALVKGRLSGKHDHHGDHNPRAKVTTSQVVEIRAQKANGVSRHKLSEMYGISKITIDQIVSRRTWRHIP